MVRLVCVACNAEYDEQRFIWEMQGETQDAVGQLEDLPVKADSKDVDPLGDAVSTCDTLPPLFDPDDNTSAERQSTGVARYCDVVRCSGTAANVTGFLAPAACGLCGPVSVVGGIVGATSGVMQLRTGLSRPSGLIDPHLVTKGGITAGVGGTCAILAAIAASTVSPCLFLVALALGLSGVGAATVVDASMSGLCECCRQAPPDIESETDENIESEDTCGDIDWDSFVSTAGFDSESDAEPAKWASARPVPRPYMPFLDACIPLDDEGVRMKLVTKKGETRSI